MTFKQFVILLMAGTLLGVGTRGQDLPASETESSAAGQAAEQAPTFSTAQFKFVEKTEQLKMLAEAVAANESILAKQKESLSQLAELETRAQAAKSAAAKSVSRHK